MKTSSHLKQGNLYTRKELQEKFGIKDATILQVFLNQRITPQSGSLLQSKKHQIGHSTKTPIKVMS
jgi:hypothetical protein